MGDPVWKAAQKRLPDLKSRLAAVDKIAPMFDAHDLFEWVRDNPEEAALCIHSMHEQLRRIYNGFQAMNELDFPEY